MPDSIPSLQDVLEAYILEANNNGRTLARYLHDFPQFAGDLVDLSAELARRLDVSTAPLDEADQSRIERAWQGHLAAARGSLENLMAKLSPTQLGALAKRLDIPAMVLSAFAQGRVIVGSVPRCFLQAMADELQTSVQEMKCGLELLPHVETMRGTEQPQGRLPMVMFEELLRETGVSEAKRIAIMGEKH